MMSLEAAHVVSGKVKGAIRATTPQVLGVLVHMEPHHDDKPQGDGVRASSPVSASTIDVSALTEGR